VLEEVAMLTYSGGSGIGHYSHSLCRELAKGGQRIKLVTNHAFPFTPAEAGYHVRKLFKKLRWYPLDLVRLLAELLQNGNRVVHFQSYLFYPAAECFLLAILRLAGRKTVITVHDILPFAPRFYHNALFRIYYRLFHKIIVHSEMTMSRLLEEFRIEAGKIKVIPHGLYDLFLPSEPVSKKEARAQVGLTVDQFVILFFGHITERKGVEDLVDAFVRIKDRYPHASLVLAGKPGGDLDRVITACVGDSRIVTDFTYLATEKVTLYFTAADIVVLPYRETTTSGVLKIAMAFNMPVIVTTLGELPEFIRDGWNGFLCPPCDPPALAGCLDRLLGQPDLLAQMGRNAAEVYRDELDWRRIAARTMQVYDALP
jgi:glycosyltransferase involved in cell wall biosynthesis